MKNIILFSALSFFLSACVSGKVPKGVKRALTIRAKELPCNNCNRISTNGFFEITELERQTYGYGSHAVISDTFKRDMIFYNDGSFVNQPLHNNVGGILGCYNVRISDRKLDTNQYFNWQDWGFYRISNDTIHIQYVHRQATANDNWRVCEEKYKIIDETTLMYIPISFRILYPRQTATDTKNILLEIGKSKYLPAKFIECNNIPPSNCWLKNQDWVIYK